METIVVILLGVVFYLFVRTSRLNREIKNLRQRADHFDEVAKRLAGASSAPPKPEPAPPPQQPVEPAQIPRPAPPKPQYVPPPPRAAEPPRIEKAPPPAAPRPTPPPPPPKKVRPAISWEQQIGARLPVWIGGIALALSGIFLVKYSIDTGLLSPAVRCALAGLLGLALLGGAQWVTARKTVANGARIAQALAGSGIAVLYGSLFAAGTVYEFFSPALTFAAMAGVTATAVLLALRHGPPIAMLGMVGGFLTPMLVGATDPNPAVLFGYLIALSVGLFVVVRRENWWWLAWPIVAACFAWILIWLAGSGTPGDSVWIGLFVIAVCAVSVAFIGPPGGVERAPLANAGLLATGAVAVAVMTFVVIRGDFGLGEWRLYGLLAVGAVVLAALDQERYRLLPWIAIAPVAALLSVWVTPDTESFVVVLSLFALLFTASGIFMIGRARHPLDWGALSCVAMLGFFLLAYARLYDVVEAARVLTPNAPFASWPIWGIIAVALATVATLVAGRIAETKPGDRTHQQRMLGLFALTAVALITAGLLIEVPLRDLPVAMAALLIAVAFMDARVDIDALRPAAYALTALFVLLILPQFAELSVYAARTIAGTRLPNAIQLPPTLTGPLFYLGAPAALLATASWFARWRRDDVLVRAFEGLAVFLIAVLGYVLIRRADTPVEQVLMMLTPSGEGALISQALLVYAMALAAAGRTWKRDMLVAAGIVAGFVAIARVVHFDIQPFQLMSVWIPMAVGEVGAAITSLPVAASPVFYLGIPAVLLVGLRLVTWREEDDWLVRLAEYAAVVLVGLMGYFLIRHAFNPAAEVLTAAGSRFEGGVISQAQIVYAAALVVAGRFFARASLIHAAAIAAAVAIARILFFDVKLLTLVGVTIQLTAGQAVDASLTSPAAAAPLFHLALPAALLAGLAYVARNEMQGWISRAGEYTVVAFAGLMTYYLIRHAFNAPEDVFAGAGSYTERGVLTNAFLVVGAAAYVAGARFKRVALRIGGAIAAVFAVLRLGFFDILVSSPLVEPHNVGSWPVVNALLLPYGLPVAWALLAARALARRNLERFVPIVHAGAMLLVFALVSLNVRQLFQGPILNAAGVAGDAEIYAYSIAWLILGIGLLVAGTWRRDKIIRFASLGVMVLTVGKVFLYDASELTGLLRVLSFLGLGLSLLGLSWFYTRYVFAPPQSAAPAGAR